jgi:flagellar biosynthesis repressor protein FlbT
MSSTLSLLLKAGDRLYLNGAVIRTDRKVRIDILNDATFLLGHHLMQADHADTPLKQLYFAVQSILVEPETAPAARMMALGMLPRLEGAFSNPDILTGLAMIGGDIRKGRPYQALKSLRALFAIEGRILADERERAVA